MRQELSDREAKVTDAQLQALASAHQVDQLRDQLLQTLEEVNHLRAENHQLKETLTLATNQIHRDNSNSSTPKVAASPTHNATIIATNN